MYRIEYFDDVILPQARPEDDLGTGDVSSGIVAAIGGPVDGYGSRRVQPQKRQIRMKGIYTRPGFWVDAVNGNQMVDESGNLLVWTDPEYEIAYRTDLLKRLLGQKKRLWRKNEWNGGRTYLNARLMAVNAVRVIENAGNALEVSAVFESTELWRESTQQSKAVTLAAAGTMALQETNHGVVVLDATLTIVAAAAITVISFSGMGSNWTLTKTMSAGQSLVIDCGSMAITLAGAASYSGFVLNSTHTAQGWIVINSGDNLWYVTADGACTATLRWYRQWP